MIANKGKVMINITLQDLSEHFKSINELSLGSGFKYRNTGRNFIAEEIAGKRVSKSSASRLMISYVAEKLGGTYSMSDDLDLIRDRLGVDCYDTLYLNRYESRVDVMLEECNNALNKAMDDFGGDL